MTHRSRRFTWEEGDLEIVKITRERRVGGKDFEISLCREGSDWHWKARFVGQEETWASGTVSDLDAVGSAVTAISWDLFSRIVQESENEQQPLGYPGAIPPWSDVDGIGKPWTPPAEGAQAQEIGKPRMILTGLGEDRSLEAYKAWINGILVGLLGPEEAANRRTMTEEDWVKAHRKFWAGADRSEVE